ncbi:MAG: recombinase family protein [Firmicutes bacterium]|nr:recombinase family protein [Bacillota bacterium]
MDKVAIYVRKSKFTGKGESIENQIDMCKKYAHNRDIKIDENLIYEDEGFSGGNVNRPQYRKMINDAKNGVFDILICYRLDRISRNVADFSDTLEILQDNDIAFVSVKEQFDTSTPMGRAMMYIASVFAQLERETIAERIRDNMYQLARNGRWLGGRTPFGYKSQPIGYTDKENNRKKMYKLISVQEELELIKSIYTNYLKFGSLTQLESWTLETNIKTRNNKDFDKTSLKMILTNPVYVIADELIYEYFESLNSDIASNKLDFNSNNGLMVYNKHDVKKNKIIKKDKENWIVAIGKHKGIIPSSTWIRVQKQLKVNSKKAPRAGTGQYGLITHLLRCKCGSKMRVIVNKKDYGTYHYYKCLMKERSRGSRCKIQNISGKIADKEIMQELISLSKDDSALMQNLNNKTKECSILSKKTINEKQRLEKVLKEKERSIKNLTLQLSNNKESIASKYIIKQIEELDKELQNTKQKLINIDKTHELTLLEKNNNDILRNMIKEFASSADNLTFEEKKKYLTNIVDDIKWNGNKLFVNIVGQNN